MKFADWKAEKLKDKKFVEALNKYRGKRVQIAYGIDFEYPGAFAHKYHSKKGKYVYFIFWFFIFYMSIEIRYHKMGETPWLRNNA